MVLMDRPPSESSENMASDENFANNPDNIIEESEDQNDPEWANENNSDVFLDDIIDVIEFDNLDENGSDEEMETDSEIVRDDADLTFTEHKESIFSCDISLKLGFAVTGSQEHKALIWNIHTGDVVFEIKDFEDSVIHCGFSHDSKYLVAADMSGSIQVWNVSDKLCVWNEKIQDITWLKWHPKSAVLLVCDKKGVTFMWKIPDGYCKVLPSHGLSECGMFMPDGKRCVIDYEGSVYVYDLKTGESLASFGRDREGTRNCNAISMDVHPINDLFAIGGTSNSITVFNIQPPKIVATYSDTSKESEDLSIEAVKFCPDPQEPWIVAGSITGTLIIWNYVKNAVRNVIQMDSGITRILWDKPTFIIFVGTIDGTINKINGKDGTLHSQLLGHIEAVLDIAMPEDGSMLLSASDDGTAKIFNFASLDR